MKPVGFVGIERKPQVNFITEAGTYRFKVVAHEVDGYTMEGNERNKYTFEAQKASLVDGKPKLSEELYTMSAIYNVDEKQAWVYMNLNDAFKLDYFYLPDALVGYYFMADIEMVQGKQDPSKHFPNINPYSYRYSIANKDLPPIKEHKVENNEAPFEETETAIVQEAELLF